MLVDVIHEVPPVGEGPVVVPGELVQHQTAGFADAIGVLEQIDQCLRRFPPCFWGSLPDRMKRSTTRQAA